MKKLLLAVFLLTATTAMVTLGPETSFARSGGNSIKIPASEVPRRIKKEFRAQYPTATQVEWEYQPVYYGTPVYTAKFTLNGIKIEASYS